MDTCRAARKLDRGSSDSEDGGERGIERAKSSVVRFILYTRPDLAVYARVMLSNGCWVSLKTELRQTTVNTLQARVYSENHSSQAYCQRTVKGGWARPLSERSPPNFHLSPDTPFSLSFRLHRLQISEITNGLRSELCLRSEV